MYLNVDSDFIFQGRHSTYMYKVIHIYIFKTEISNTDFEIRENMLHIVIQRDQHLRERKDYVWLKRNKEKRWQERDSITQARKVHQRELVVSHRESQ